MQLYLVSWNFDDRSDYNKLLAAFAEDLIQFSRCLRAANWWSVFISPTWQRVIACVELSQ